MPHHITSFEQYGHHQLFRTFFTENAVLPLCHHTYTIQHNKKNYPSLWDNDVTQILCWLEHHLSTEVIQTIITDNYNLSAYYGRKHAKFGGVHIFIFISYQFVNTGCLVGHRATIHVVKGKILLLIGINPDSNTI
jgi:drug/metabolite transporter superfamily protein YnfA